MAKTNYRTIDEYHAAFSGETARRLEQVREIVHRVVPAAEETISYQVPCFKYNGYLLYYAAFARHITLSHPFSAALLKKFKKDLQKYQVSKAAIQFPHAEKLPLAFIRRLVAYRKKENEARSKITNKPKRRKT